MLRANVAWHGVCNPKGRNMFYDIKVLGLAVIAVMSVSAMLASPASAGLLTSDGPVKATGTESPATLTLIAGQKLECHSVETWSNFAETPHGPLKVPTSTITIEKHETNCVAVIGELKAPATVTMNGCDFTEHVGAKLESGKYASTTDIVCAGGKSIEIHAYSSAAHSSTVCTYVIPAQVGLAGGFVKNVAGGKIELGGPITGIKATRSGILCGGNAETKEAKEDVGIVISGTNEGGSATSIEVTGS